MNGRPSYRRARSTSLRRRSAPAIAAAAAAVTFGNIPDAAAQWSDTRIGRNGTTADGILMVRMIAECYVGRHSENVSKLLDTLPGVEGEADIVRQDADDLSECLYSPRIVFDGLEVRFDAAMLRRPLGAEMARRFLMKNKKAPSPAPDVKPWFYERMEKLPADAMVNYASLEIQEFGHCVALSKWDESRALLLSRDNSSAEKAAVEKMIPALGPCLKEGTTITITKRNLREMIGEPVYHLLLASQGSGNL